MKIQNTSGLAIANQFVACMQAGSTHLVFDRQALAMIADGLATKVDSSDDGNGDSLVDHGSTT